MTAHILHVKSLCACMPVALQVALIPETLQC